MPDLIKVGMADYKVGAAPSTLISYGLGSCIGLSLYDPQAKVGEDTARAAWDSSDCRGYRPQLRPHGFH